MIIKEMIWKDKETRNRKYIIIAEIDGIEIEACEVITEDQSIARQLCLDTLGITE